MTTDPQDFGNDTAAEFGMLATLVSILFVCVIGPGLLLQRGIFRLVSCVGVSVDNHRLLTNLIILCRQRDSLHGQGMSQLTDLARDISARGHECRRAGIASWRYEAWVDMVLLPPP
jgi:hypothetical protein